MTTERVFIARCGNIAKPPTQTLFAETTFLCEGIRKAKRLSCSRGRAPRGLCTAEQISEHHAGATIETMRALLADGEGTAFCPS